MTQSIEQLKGLLEKATPGLLSVSAKRMAEILLVGVQNSHPLPKEVGDYEADGEAIAALLRAAPTLLSQIESDKARRGKMGERISNLATGLEEIRDSIWPGDDAVERIRKCAAYWLSGEAEKLDDRMRSDIARATLTKAQNHVR